MHIERKNVGHGNYQWFLDSKKDHRPESQIWQWLKTIPFKDKFGCQTVYDRASADLLCEGYIDINN